MGDDAGAAARFRDLHDDLLEKGREAEATDALREAVRLNPGRREGRACWRMRRSNAGDAEAAREYLDRAHRRRRPSAAAGAGGDGAPGRRSCARRASYFSSPRTRSRRRDEVVELGWSLCESNPDATFACIDAAVDGAIAASEFEARRGLAPGVRRTRAGAHPGAAEAGRGLRRRRPRDRRCTRPRRADRRVSGHAPGRPRRVSSPRTSSPGSRGNRHTSSASDERW